MTNQIAPAAGPRDFVDNRYLFGRLERYTISLVAFLLHLLSIVYLLSFSFAYTVISDNDAFVLHIYQPKVQVVLFVGLALMHFRGLVLVLTSPCSKSDVAIFDPNKTSATLVGKFKHWYAKYFSRYGAFGLHGELFDMRVALKQAFQIPSQGYQAYQMSIYLTDPFLCALYTLLLACDCLFVPCLLFSKSNFARRWGPGFIDAIFDFALGAGFPLAVTLRGMYEVFVAGGETILHDKMWLNRMIMLGRFVAVTNVMDMFTTLFPFVTCYYSLKNLNEAVRLRAGNARHESNLSQAYLIMKDFKYKAPMLELIRWGFLVTSIVTGIFFCFMAAFAIVRDPCPPGCLLQSYPWFNRHCHCVMMRQNCVLNPLPKGYDIDMFVEELLPNVFDLMISQCDVPHGLKKETLESLNNLYALTLRRTNTLEWNLNPADMPQSLCAMYFQDQAVAAFPRALFGAAYNLKYIYFRNVSITTNKTIPKFPPLFMLSLSNVTLTAIPPFVFDYSKMTNLEFDNNELEAIPLELTALSSIQSVSLMFNKIKEIPAAFVQNFPPTLKGLYLDGNPIQSLPPETNPNLLTSMRLRIMGTPMCDRLLKARAANQVATLPPLEKAIVDNLDVVCGPECELGCHKKYLGNMRCDSVCMTPSCNYDTPKDKFQSSGYRASDCNLELTGWEP